jgi:hypothetical protein
MSVMDDAIMKDKILKLIYEGTSLSTKLSEVSGIAHYSVIALSEEMKDRGHILITKASSDGAAILILQNKGRHFFETSSYVFELENEIKKQQKESPSMNVSDNVGNVFIHSPVSDSTIETATPPNVKPKKKMNTKSAIILIAAIVATIAGLIAIYEFIIKK